MDFIKKNKNLCIFIGCILIFLLVLFIFLKQFMVDPTKDSYGDRLSGIENVKINNDRLKDMINELSKDSKVDKITYRINGRLVNIIIIVNGDTSIDDAKGLANKTLEYFKDEEKKYYDIQVLLDSEKDSEDYPTIGYKHKTSDNLVWKQ